MPPKLTTTRATLIPPPPGSNRGLLHLIFSGGGARGKGGGRERGREGEGGKGEGEGGKGGGEGRAGRGGGGGAREEGRSGKRGGGREEGGREGGRGEGEGEGGGGERGNRRRRGGDGTRTLASAEMSTAGFIVSVTTGNKIIFLEKRSRTASKLRRDVLEAPCEKSRRHVIGASKLRKHSLLQVGSRMSSRAASTQPPHPERPSLRVASFGFVVSTAILATAMVLGACLAGL